MKSETYLLREPVVVPRWGWGAQVARPPNLAVLWILWSTDSQKISKFDATRCQILKLKYTKFDFRWGSAPDPAGLDYNSPPDSAVFKAAYF